MLDLSLLGAYARTRASHTERYKCRNEKEPGSAGSIAVTYECCPHVEHVEGLEYLTTSTATCWARRDGSGFELFEMLEHADHRVARSSMRLIRDRATEADAELRT